jgi:hypothetical protein
MSQAVNYTQIPYIILQYVKPSVIQEFPQILFRELIIWADSDIRNEM